MNNRVYDILKFISLIIVPFCGMVTAIIVAFQTGDAVAIITAIGEAIATFLGTVLTISSKMYWTKQGEQKEADA